MAAPNRRDARRARLSVAAVQSRAGDQHPATRFRLVRPDAGDAAALGANSRLGYVDNDGMLEARLCGSLPLARPAGLEMSKGELMRYLTELIWAPHAMLHNPALAWRQIDATTVEVRPPAYGRTSHGADELERTLRRLSRDGRLPHTDAGGGGLILGRRPFRILARQSNRVWHEVTVRLRHGKAGLLTWISAVAGRGRKILRWIGGCITKAVIENLALRRRTGALRSP